MKTRREQISCIVEEALFEAEGGYLSGVRMGAFPREGDTIPQKFDVLSLSNQEDRLRKLSTNPSKSRFTRAAAAEELRNVQRDIISAANPQTRENLIKKTIMGVKTGKRLRKYVIDPVKGIFANIGSKTWSLATSADRSRQASGWKV